jgi:hypothetical protein
MVAFESADGKDLYYSVGPFGSSELELRHMPVNGGDEKRISAALFQNAFAPATNGIYFLEGAATLDSPVRLQFLDFGTQAIRTVTVMPAPAGDEISVSPDGRNILFDRADREDAELMLMENFH